MSVLTELKTFGAELLSVWPLAFKCYQIPLKHLALCSLVQEIWLSAEVLTNAEGSGRYNFDSVQSDPDLEVPNYAN